MTAQRRLLLVDDIPDYLDVLALYLPSAITTRKATSAHEARTALDAERFDAALIDIKLDENDPDNTEGLELLRWIKERYPGLPVVMISAYRQFEFETESLASGAEYFVRKPINPDEIVEVIGKVLERGAAHGEGGTACNC